MKLISWNVNGLRACIQKGFSDAMTFCNADVFCLQETKMQPEQLTFSMEEYEIIMYSADKKGYSGTAIFTKKTPLSVSFGIGIDQHDHEGRVITAEYDKFYLVNVYTPNSRRELERLDYRMVWDDAYRDYLAGLSLKKPVVTCGDFNVAHREIDLKNPKTNTRNAGFTIEERTKFSALLDSGFTDTFRHINGDIPHRYSWWSYMGQARANNAGWRIDYFLTSDSIKEQILNADIYHEIYGSDHCPVMLELDV